MNWNVHKRNESALSEVQTKCKNTSPMLKSEGTPISGICLGSGNVVS